MQQITTLAAATNEFLRQFWSALHPPSVDDSRAGVSKSLATATAAQREVKMTKMIGYLRMTQDKVQIIYDAAPHAGVEIGRLQAVSINYSRKMICHI